MESVGQKLLTAFHLADITVHSFVPVFSFEGIKAFGQGSRGGEWCLVEFADFFKCDFCSFYE